jgi:hypothetical protein
MAVTWQGRCTDSGQRSTIDEEDEPMGQQRTKRRERTRSRVRNLASTAVDHAEATRVVGGEAKQQVPEPPKPYLTYKLKNVQITSYS